MVSSFTLYKQVRWQVVSKDRRTRDRWLMPPFILPVATYHHSELNKSNNSVSLSVFLYSVVYPVHFMLLILYSVSYFSPIKKRRKTCTLVISIPYNHVVFFQNFKWIHVWKKWHYLTQRICIYSNLNVPFHSRTQDQKFFYPHSKKF